MRTNLSSRIKLDQVSTRYYKPEGEVEMASLTRCEKIYTKVVSSMPDGSQDVANDIAQYIEQCVAEKGRCVMGLGAGRSALTVYDQLVKLYFADKVSFANVIAFSLSELGMGTDTHGQSTYSRLNDRLYSKVDILPENVHTFSGDANKDNVHSLCKRYEAQIADYGGLDLVVCQLTKNGGMAFNDPGSSSTSSCRLVLLGNESRQRIADSYQCEVAPLTGVTLGMSNILGASKILAVAWGEDSARSVRDSIEGNITDQVPASFLQMHHDVKVVVDLEAAALLTRISLPWKVTSCEWTPQLTRRAIVWLSQTTGKPILKLTNKDYHDNGLGELTTVFGSGYNANIRIFNEMQHTITGWPGGKPNADDTSRPERALPYPKRVLVFSPHPDDAIVSMGGTIRRLVQQGHEVHVVFQTNGDLTVADENLERSIMLHNKMASYLSGGNSSDDAKNQAFLQSVIKKDPNSPDTPAMRAIKGMIFASEGIMGCKHMGVDPANIHELELPYYTEHPLGRGRITEADVAPIAKLIEQVRPHQIFFADVLSDPFGAYSLAADVVLAAIDELKDQPCMSECRVWIFRGQWGSWDVDHVNMAVPMSPEEFSYKREAVLKYQSQVHDAIYRDPEDGKLGWERSLDRNHNTADIYSALGLASYEAMETFVRYIPDQL